MTIGIIIEFATLWVVEPNNKPNGPWNLFFHQLVVHGGLPLLAVAPAQTFC